MSPRGAWVGVRGSSGVKLLSVFRSQDQKGKGKSPYRETTLWAESDG